jgi:hypothetical protein
MQETSDPTVSPPLVPVAPDPKLAVALETLHPTPAPEPEQDPETKQALDNFEANKDYIIEGDHTYNTELTPKEELLFREWVRRNKVRFDVNNTGVTDYDMRGFWKAYSAGDPKAVSSIDPNDKELHYSDYWKTPYHKTFSAESQWADPEKAPKWNEIDQLVLPNGTVIYDDRDNKPRQSDEVISGNNA